MNAYEHFALNEYLSYYPDELSFDEVLTLLSNDDPEVAVWDAFFNHSAEDVIDLITILRDNLEEVFIPRKENK